MFLILLKIISQFIQLRLDPASGNTVPASGNGSVTQGLNLTNNQHGQVYEDQHPSLPIQFFVLSFHFILIAVLSIYPTEQKPVAMRIRLSYKVNGEDRLEQGQISNFPSGL